jgi:hypothetical protein
MGGQDVDDPDHAFYFERPNPGLRPIVAWSPLGLSEAKKTTGTYKYA